MGDIVLCFADNPTGTYQYAFPEMASRGLRGIVLVPTALVGARCRCTWPQLAELDAAGWDVCSHLDTGGNCEEMTIAELLYHLTLAYGSLLRYGHAGRFVFGPPGDHWNASLTPTALLVGHTVIMAAANRGGVMPPGGPGGGWVFQKIGCANRNAIADIQTAIDHCVAHADRLLVLDFHQVVGEDADGTQADVSRMLDVLDRAEASGVPIVTWSDLMP